MRRSEVRARWARMRWADGASALDAVCPRVSALNPGRLDAVIAELLFINWSDVSVERHGLGSRSGSAVPANRTSPVTARRTAGDCHGCLDRRAST